MKIFVKDNVKKYEELYKSGHDHSYPNLDLIRILSTYIKAKNKNILDFGFGSGQNIIHMTKMNFKRVYALEASNEAIKLLKNKLKKNNAKKKVTIKKLNEHDKSLPFKSNFFDTIICTSVLSLLENKKNIKALINEFQRILKKGGKLVVDINGPQSSFKKKGKFVSEDTYISYIKNKRQKVLTYCPQKQKIFAKLFKNFYIDDLGEIKFRYFSFSGHEFIACLRKK